MCLVKVGGYAPPHMFWTSYKQQQELVHSGALCYSAPPRALLHIFAPVSYTVKKGQRFSLPQPREVTNKTLPGS